MDGSFQRDRPGKVAAGLGRAAWIAAAGLPWLLCLLPFTARLAAVAGLAAAAALLWLRPPARAAGRGRRLPAAALAALGVLCAWVSLASYSAQLSRLGPGRLYPALAAGIVLPLILACPPGRGGCNRPPARPAVWAWAALLLAAGLPATPGRRYAPSGGQAVRTLAADREGIRDCVAWVHGHVDYASAPFTDTAADTLRRRRARCGGMANLLHKLLQARGVEARIVHLERGAPWSGPLKLHTLVEVRAAGDAHWTLADPQHNLLGLDFGGVNAGALLAPRGREDLPRPWRRFNRVYVYRRGRGYVRVSPQRLDAFYDDPETHGQNGD